MTLSHHCTVAWVTRPERPNGVKDVIKQARRAATQKSGPGGPLDFNNFTKQLPQIATVIQSEHRLQCNLELIGWLLETLF